MGVGTDRTVILVRPHDIMRVRLADVLQLQG